MVSGEDEVQTEQHQFRSVSLSPTTKTCVEDCEHVDVWQNDVATIQHLDISNRLPSAFFGRSREKAALFNAYESNLDSSNDSLTRKTSFVLIKGAKGVGKSWLLQKTLKERVASDQSARAGAGAGAYYITYRFDQFQRSHITRIFDEAFEDFAQQCIARGSREVAVVQRLVQESSELHIESMIQIIPSMGQILLSESPLSSTVSENTNTATTPSLGHSARRSGLLRGFLRALSKERPIVFVFENCQWAHEATLDILNGIVPPLKDSRVLFVGTYRPDCEPFFKLPSIGDGELGVLIKKWEEHGVGVRRMELEPLQDDAMADLVAHLLSPSDECQDVTRFVCDTVSGNPSHAVELLRSICESSLLTFDVDTSRLRLRRDSDSFERLSKLSEEELVRKRIQRMTPDTQKMLKVAAVFGCEIHEMLLSHALGGSAGTMVSPKLYLDEAVAAEVLETCADHVRFGSNLIQEAAYSFIDQKRRKGFHVALGRQLWKSMTMDEVNDNLAKVLFQINLGTDLIKNDLERYALASLMYSLGSRAAKDSSFIGGAFLLEKALSLLGKDRWRVEHDLCLAIYNTLAETKYAIGDFERVAFLVKEILANARAVDERLQAHCTYVFMLIADNKTAMAVDEGLAILCELGETLPKHPSRRQLRRSSRCIDKKLKGKTLEFILRLPTITDNKKLACMKLLNILFSPAFMVDPLLAAMICNRMMKMTLEYGSCTITSCVLSLRGIILCWEMRVEEASEHGQLALRMLDKYKTKEFLPRVYAGVYGEINLHTRPIEESLEPLWQSVVTAMETGDIEFGILNSNVYCTLAFYQGHPLSELKAQLYRVRQDMVILNQKSLQAFNIPILETVNFLQGGSMDAPDASNVYGGLPTAKSWALGQTCLRTYLMGDYESAAGCGEQFLRSLNGAFMGLDALVLSTYASLALLAKCRQEKKSTRKRSMSHARSSIKLLEEVATHAPDFFLSKLHLLKAELCALEKDSHQAYRHYTIAIAMGVKTGYLVDEAVANERAGLYMTSGEGKQKWAALKYFEQAIDAYKRWGATAKVQHLESELENVRRLSSLTTNLSTSRFPF